MVGIEQQITREKAHLLAKIKMEDRIGNSPIPGRQGEEEK